jgi:hypothetical protein
MQLAISPGYLPNALFGLSGILWYVYRSFNSAFYGAQLASLLFFFGGK